MKHLKKITALLVVLALAVTLLSACGANPEKEIIGSWRESSGKLGYDFAEDGTVKLHYLDFTIPIINMNLNDDLEGTYSIQKTDDGVYHLFLHYNILIDIDEEFTFTIEKDNLVITNVNTGNTYTLIRAAAPAESAAPSESTDPSAAN